jgi:NAD(P)-dependent dehydrogenase (short-subunit alcohol dehydrogenase family)
MLETETEMATDAQSTDAQAGAACSCSSGAYIVTGGLGGLGLVTAKVLARAGAKHIFLVSRSGRVSYEGQGLEEDLAWLQSSASGAAVHTVRCDVSDESAVEAMLAECRRVAGSIEGVVHSAGVPRDGLIRGGAAAERSADVWKAKALSAWWLHKHTTDDDLRVFISFSSITAALGNPGQSAYGAANRFLDGLMAERMRRGAHGLSIRWPAISGVGMAAGGVLLYEGDKEGAVASGTIGPAEVAQVLESSLRGSMSSSGSGPILTVVPRMVLAMMAGSRVWSQFSGVELSLGAEGPSARDVAQTKRKGRAGRGVGAGLGAAGASASKLTGAEIREIVVRVVASLEGDSDGKGVADSSWTRAWILWRWLLYRLTIH